MVAKVANKRLATGGRLTIGGGVASDALMSLLVALEMMSVCGDSGNCLSHPHSHFSPITQLCNSGKVLLGVGYVLPYVGRLFLGRNIKAALSSSLLSYIASRLGIPMCTIYANYLSKKVRGLSPQDCSLC